MTGQLWIHERIVKVKPGQDGYSVQLASGLSFWLEASWLGAATPRPGDMLSCLIADPLFAHDMLGHPILAATLNELMLFDTREEAANDLAE